MLLIPNTTYELFTPYGNEDAAQILYEFLQSVLIEDNEAAITLLERPAPLDTTP